ncbi:NAD(P)-binding domain-containing protein [Paraflavisolibacter sp. H34]|uniref:NADPH-dependent F420 reductase n=1 Tax=Huijunlia imazamoxiresistens TaxID=3127457 RepID=UPI003017A776
MKIGVLGTGVVGKSIASALVKQKHLVRLGSRSATNAKAEAWLQESGDYASIGDFDDAAAFGDLLFFCLNGEYALDVAGRLDRDSVHGKVIIDTTNPLDFTRGLPPRILEGLGNGNSLGEELQRALPGSFVVKALNTVNHELMVDARLVNKGEHNLFICGNNAEAKNKVKHFLVDNFRWKADRLVDLGPIEASRVTEAFVPFWVSIWQHLGTPLFNFKIVR